MSLILLSLLAFTVIGVYLKTDDNNIDVEPIDDNQVVNLTPNNYLGKIKDNYGVDNNVMDLIVDYMNTYFKSLYSLNLNTTRNCFTDETLARISDNAIKLMIETRKLYDFDFKMSDAKYDLKVTDYYLDDDTYYVFVLEDDYFNYNFLNGITSESRNIECMYAIKYVQGEYRIADLRKEQGYYSMFYDSEANSVDDINDEYEYYFNKLKNVIDDENKQKLYVSQKPYNNNAIVKYKYNRDLAKAYADKYYCERNLDWYDFSDDGGNCQNFASQVIVAGGLPMDYLGENQWKCYIEDPDYDPEIEYEEIQSGRTASWVDVSYFYDYVTSKGSSLVCDVNDNIYYAQIGDIIQVGLTSYSHTTVVNDVIDGHILLNSNTLDMKNVPLESYTYPNRRLIKILGSN